MRREAMDAHSEEASSHGSDNVGRGDEWVSGHGTVYNPGHTVEYGHWIGEGVDITEMLGRMDFKDSFNWREKHDQAQDGTQCRGNDLSQNSHSKEPRLE